MRIGFDAKRIFHNRSGLGNYSRDLVRILEAYYPENQYLLYNPKPGEVKFDIPEGSKEVLPLGHLGKMLPMVWRRKWIVDDLVRDKIDLFHGLSNELPAGLPEKKIPAIVTIHDLIFYKFPEWYKPADSIIQQQKALQAATDADLIIAISEQTKKDILHYLPVKENKIKVVYQGCHEAFKKKYTFAEIAKAKLRYQLPDNFILSVGTIEERKNLLTTVKSLNYHDLNLVVVGRRTPYYDKVQELIKKSGFEDRIQFLEPENMEDLALIYQQAFALCYPSIYEGFGIPIIEALFSGVPVITNKEGVFPETAGPTGIFMEATDAKAMATGIKKLKYEAFRNEVIEMGYSHARKFSDDVIAKEMEEAYKQVLSKYSK